MSEPKLSRACIFDIIIDLKGKDKKSTRDVYQFHAQLFSTLNL